MKILFKMRIFRGRNENAGKCSTTLQKPQRVKMSTEVMMERPEGKTETKQEGSNGPLYVIRCIVNFVAILILFCCGVALVSIGWRTHAAQMWLGHSSVSLAGGILILLSIDPLLTLLNWVNMHNNYHEPTASQARWELDHSAEPRKSLASSTDTTVVEVRLEDGDVSFSNESLPLPIPVPKMAGQEMLRATKTEHIQVAIDGNPLSRWDGKGLPSLLELVPIDSVGQIRYSEAEEK